MSAPRDDVEVDVATIGEDVRLLEGMRTTRAIRRLRPDPVPRELIRKVCEAATYAPSDGQVKNLEHATRACDTLPGVCMLL